VSVNELVSKVRDFMRSLPPDRIREVTRGDLTKVLGIDPIKLPRDVKMVIARILYNEFKLPYRWIASRIALSPNDVQLAVKGLRISRFEGRVDVNVIVSAIKLFREGKVRNPNDLIVELKLDPEVAEHIFYDIIIRNEGITTLDVIEAVQKLEEYLRKIREYSQDIEAVEKKVKENINTYKTYLNYSLENFKKELDEELKRIETKVNEVQERLNNIKKELREADIKIRGLTELNKYIKSISTDVNILKDEIKNLKNDINILKSFKDKTLSSLESLSNDVNNFKVQLKKVEDLLNMISRSFEGLKEVSTFLTILTLWLKVQSEAIFSSEGMKCVHIDSEGYCTKHAFLTRVSGLSIKEVSKGNLKKYYPNVMESKWLCVLCKSYKSKIEEEFLEEFEEEEFEEY